MHISSRQSPSSSASAKRRPHTPSQHALPLRAALGECWSNRQRDQSVLFSFLPQITSKSSVTKRLKRIVSKCRACFSTIPLHSRVTSERRTTSNITSLSSKHFSNRYLFKWWAQYLESVGEMDSAKEYYKAGGDYLSVVRICCFVGDMDAVGCERSVLSHSFCLCC